MSKYFCLCGRVFSRKKYADKHADFYKDCDELTQTYHIIIKKLWRARLREIALDYRWYRFFRLMGGFIVLMVMEHHFQIKFSYWESIFLGIGMGLYID